MHHYRKSGRSVIFLLLPSLAEFRIFTVQFKSFETPTDKYLTLPFSTLQPIGVVG
jgi:hypothetical protein